MSIGYFQQGKVGTVGNIKNYHGMHSTRMDRRDTCSKTGSKYIITDNNSFFITMQ